MIPQIFTGKSRPANTLSRPANMLSRPANTKWDLYNRAIIIRERDFYREIHDFLRDSINGRDVTYP